MSQAPNTTISGLLSAGGFNGILGIEANPLPTLQGKGEETGAEQHRGSTSPSKGPAVTEPYTHTGLADFSGWLPEALLLSKLVRY